MNRTLWTILTMLLISVWIVTHTHKYEQTWEIDYGPCGIQTHAAQCDGMTLFY